jgi:hypothetical protein
MLADPPPPEHDVHLRVQLGGLLLDYRATSTAARNFLADWKRTHCETIEIIIDSTEDRQQLPRLPCERLFLYP